MELAKGLTTRPSIDEKVLQRKKWMKMDTPLLIIFFCQIDKGKSKSSSQVPLVVRQSVMWFCIVILPVALVGKLDVDKQNS